MCLISVGNNALPIEANNCFVNNTELIVYKIFIYCFLRKSIRCSYKKFCYYSIIDSVRII